MERSSLLIADGNRDACSHLKLLFSEMFGSIDCAADGIAAIKLFRRHVYHLVILDAMLPVADGRTVCRQICKMSDVPVVIISERSALPERLSAYRSGAEDYIVKPFEGDELLARMNIILRRREHVPAKPPRALIFSGSISIRAPVRSMLMIFPCRSLRKNMICCCFCRVTPGRCIRARC